MTAVPGSIGGNEEQALLNIYPYFGRIRQIVEPMKSRELSVLDVGCGPGMGDLRLLKHMGLASLVGADIRDVAPDARGLGIEYIKSDIESNLPVADARFDVVLMDNVIEHMYEPRKILTECLRVLKKGGSFIGLTPNQARLTNRLRLLMGRSVYYPLEYWLGNNRESHVDKGGVQVFAGHVREYTMAELVRMLQVVGFENVVTYLDAAARPSIRDARSKIRGAMFAYNLAEKIFPGAGYMITFHAMKP